jgi:hypothetical protein
MLEDKVELVLRQPVLQLICRFNGSERERVRVPVLERTQLLVHPAGP